MMKRISRVVLALVLIVGLSTATIYAGPGGGNTEDPTVRPAPFGASSTSAELFIDFSAH